MESKGRLSSDPHPELLCSSQLCISSPVTQFLTFSFPNSTIRLYSITELTIPDLRQRGSIHIEGPSSGDIHAAFQLTLFSSGERRAQALRCKAPQEAPGSRREGGLDSRQCPTGLILTVIRRIVCPSDCPSMVAPVFKSPFGQLVLVLWRFWGYDQLRFSLA